MGIRQKLNDNPSMAIGVAAVVIIGAAIVAVRSGCYDDSEGDPRSGPPAKMYFTTDDGRDPKLFADDASRIPPFDHEGKPAYRARVYRCSHGKQFVAYLERFNEVDRKRLQEAVDRTKAEGGTAATDGFYNTVEVKKPGDKDWVRLSNATNDRFEDIVTPVCPEGSRDDMEPVLPE